MNGLHEPLYTTEGRVLKFVQSNGVFGDSRPFFRDINKSTTWKTGKYNSGIISGYLVSTEGELIRFEGDFHPGLEGKTVVRRYAEDPTGIQVTAVKALCQIAKKSVFNAEDPDKPIEILFWSSDQKNPGQPGQWERGTT